MVGARDANDPVNVDADRASDGWLGFVPVKREPQTIFKTLPLKRSGVIELDISTISSSSKSCLHGRASEPGTLILFPACNAQVMMMYFQLLELHLMMMLLLVLAANSVASKMFVWSWLCKALACLYLATEVALSQSPMATPCFSLLVCNFPRNHVGRACMMVDT